MTQEIKVLLSVGIATVLIMVGGIFFLNSGQTAVVSEVKSADASILVRENSHKMSTESAKVVIVEFGDYQCPACGVAHFAVKKILEYYQGRVNFVSRQYPLPQHKNALIAAEAAEAAGEQGKFWEMNDKLYENQDKWSESDNALDIFARYAKDLGLDVEKFREDVSSKKFEDRINQDKNDGNNLGINATPTFFINGKQLAQPPTYDNLKTAIDQELKK